MIREEGAAERLPPTGDEGGGVSQGRLGNMLARNSGETASAGNATGQGLVEDTISVEVDSENMLEEGPLEDSTREEGGFSVPPTDASFYSLQVRFKAVSLTEDMLFENLKYICYT